MARLIPSAGPIAPTRLAILAAALALTAGCTKPADNEPAPTTAAAPTPAALEAAPTPKPSEPAAPAPIPAEKNYLVRITPGEAQAGQPAQSIIEVTPTPGYKMNLEFPSHLKLDPPTGAALTKAELGREDAEITEAALRFTIAYTPEQAGDLDLAGAADFSVCNENACKLIRGEKVAWEVAVK